MNYKGKNNPFYGKHHTEEANEKNRQAHLGKTHKVSDETRRKISETLKGHKISDETRIKISTTLSGKEITIKELDKKINHNKIIRFGKQRYIRAIFNNKNSSLHKKTMLEAIGITSVPKEFIVHHIDGNKKNNDLDNLALITITAHNRIHAHIPWNKGIKASENEKLKETIDKAQKTRTKHYMKIFKEWYELFNKGKSVIEIGKIFNKNRSTIYSGIKKYEQYK